MLGGVGGRVGSWDTFLGGERGGGGGHVCMQTSSLRSYMVPNPEPKASAVSPAGGDQRFVCEPASPASGSRRRSR